MLRHCVLLPCFVIAEYDRLLEGGIWAEVVIAHNDVDADAYAFYVEDLRPIQLSRFDFASYAEAKKAFTRDEWIDVVLRSVGLEPSKLSKRVKLHFVGLDVSLETVNVCIVNTAGDVLLEKKIEAEPATIIQLLRNFGAPFKRIGLEAGPTSSWLYSELHAAGFHAICLECRHVKAGLSAMRNKTDRNDARGIAQLVRLGWFRQVHIKSEQAQRTRMLLVNRQQLLNKAMDIENSVRGSLKVFGLRLGVVTRRGFEARAFELVADDPILLAITEPMLRVRRALLEEFERLDRLCQQLARRDPVCRRLMTVPGVGVIVALTYRTGVDAPERFSRSRDVGAHRPHAETLQFGTD